MFEGCSEREVEREDERVAKLQEILDSVCFESGNMHFVVLTMFGPVKPQARQQQ